MFGLVDCNNFYASCERVFQPKLEGRPVVVLSNNDGCVIARSNEAKALGVKMADPAFLIEEFLAKNNVAVFSSNYALYGDMSHRVHRTLAELVPDMEIYSIDEAFLDFSCLLNYDLREFVARIRYTVKKNIGIPVSIGVAPTKTLAKVANKIAKKDKSQNGVLVLDSEELILWALPQIDVEDIWGVGRQYSKLLRRHGITNALELRNTNLQWIRKQMTVMGARLVSELRGISCLPLNLVTPAKKGILNSRSFGQMLSDYQPIKESVATHANRVAEKLRKQKSAAHLLTVFLQTNPFKENEPQYFNSKVLQLPVATNFSTELIEYALAGLDAIFKPGYRYKKTGVMVAGIVPESHVQGNIFDEVDREKIRKITTSVDEFNRNNGRDKIKYGAQGTAKRWKLRQERLSPCFTTRWDDLLTINNSEL